MIDCNLGLVCNYFLSIYFPASEYTEHTYLSLFKSFPVFLPCLLSNKTMSTN